MWIKVVGPEDGASEGNGFPYVLSQKVTQCINQNFP